MSSLSSIQNQLLSDIFSDSPKTGFDSAGLAIYRANLRATATNALKITFPTVAQLIGDELLAYATELLLRRYPPQHGDWAVWGEHLPNVLANLEALEAYPFVAQSAALDYHCHQLVRQADAAPEHNSFSLFESQEPNDLTLVLAPGTLLLASEYPIAAIRSAHTLASAEQRNLAIKQAFQDESERHYLVCFRDGVEVRVETLSREEYQFTQALQHMSLGAALDKMNNTPFVFQNWLIKSIQISLLHSVQLITPST